MANKGDFIHNFSGFSGCPSRCHIRVLDEEDKPLVVICSQMANKPGTSVTNAAEIIFQEIQESFVQDNLSPKAAIQQHIKPSAITKILGAIITRLKDYNTDFVVALELIKLGIESTQQGREYCESYKLRSHKIKELIWVVHYDISLCLSPTNEYMKVSFRPDTSEPQWIVTTPLALSESTGYPVAEFQIDPSAIQLP